MRRFPLAAALAAALLTLSAAGSAPAASPPAKQPTAIGTGGAAATVDPVATRAAIDVLRRGGNAIDAAVAAAAVLGVVEPYSCGVGGGGFMLVYSAKDHVVHTIDSRETAPAAMTATSFTGLTDFEHQRVSGMSVGVPGTVRAWAAALYLDPDGTPRDVGTTIRNPGLARTYGLLARDGADAFYHGRLAQAIVNTVRRPPERTGAPRVVRPGVMTLTDLARYRT